MARQSLFVSRIAFYLLSSSLLFGLLLAYQGPGRASVEIDGQRVPLNPERIERDRGSKDEVGKQTIEAVRVALTRLADSP
jgi:hypothetical protein